jgi:hypothetical protein
VIVRIATEGQYELGDDHAAKLNELDNAAVAAVEGGDEGAFQAAFDEMLEIVRSNGTEVDGDELVGSDVIIPPSDLTFEEAAEEFSGDGLIPG